MNILSVSQLQAQTARADLSQVLPSERDTKTDSALPSFARALEDARKAAERPAEAEPEKTERQIPDEGQKVAKSENRSASDEGKKISDSEKIAKDDRTEKISNGEKENSVTDDEITVALASADEIAARIQNFNNIVQNAAHNEETVPTEEKNLVLDVDNHSVDEKTLAWLTSSSKSDEISDDMTANDFAKMIEAAVEFIPGSESEEEKLESAQNLAVNDPTKFLESVELAESRPIAIETQKREFPLDSDKKIVRPGNSKEKKNESKLAVYDLRTRRTLDDNSTKVDSSKIVQKSAEKKEITLSMQKQSENNVQMTMELASRAQENITSSSSQAAGATGSDFQAMLSNAVQENAPDFVKAGNIVLKDNNQGSINLILRPEGLGNVKISLNLDDKNLSAQITVQTQEAMDAFRESIPSLKQAFAESGFETGSFDLNFSQNQNQQGFAQGGNGEQNQQNAGILAHKSYGDFVTASALASGDVAEAFAGGDYSVNIVA